MAYLRLLTLLVEAPTLPPGAGAGAANISLRDVSASAWGRELFLSLDLKLTRERVAVVGPNGAGKTTLLNIALGKRAPDCGSAERDVSRIGSVAQGGADWMIDDSLLEHLAVQSSAATQDQLAEIVAAHRFPFALSQRPLRSLSPGERVRAAFICIFHRAPTPEVLVLDEPTFSLDLVGQRARTNALAAWPGGLLVASHDRAFLNAVGFDRFVALGSSSPRLDTSTPRPRRTATKH